MSRLQMRYKKYVFVNMIRFIQPALTFLIVALHSTINKGKVVTVSTIEPGKKTQAVFYKYITLRLNWIEQCIKTHT